MPKFKFQKFSLNDDGPAMKIGTDGILLGAWASCESANRILDVGTGCGLIALMLAQKTGATNSEITGIDLDLYADQQAQTNAKQSPWLERVNS